MATWHSNQKFNIYLVRKPFVSAKTRQNPISYMFCEVLIGVNVYFVEDFYMY